MLSGREVTIMQYVFVLSNDRKPLDPCHPARARRLLKRGRAAVLRRYPFTIVLKDRTAAESATHRYRLRIDPGSCTTGLAIVCEDTGRVVWTAEIRHRGHEAQQRKRRKLRPKTWIKRLWCYVPITTISVKAESPIAIWLEKRADWKKVHQDKLTAVFLKEGISGGPP